METASSMHVKASKCYNCGSAPVFVRQNFRLPHQKDYLMYCPDCGCAGKMDSTISNATAEWNHICNTMKKGVK